VNPETGRKHCATRTVRGSRRRADSHVSEGRAERCHAELEPRAAPTPIDDTHGLAEWSGRSTGLSGNDWRPRGTAW